MSHPENPPLQVFTLVVELGRKQGDGLPEGSTGAGLVVYAAGRDEAEAVRETVAVLKVAGLAALEVQSYGTREEQAEAGTLIAAEEAALMDRAEAENAVVVAQVTPFFDDDDDPVDEEPS